MSGSSSYQYVATIFSYIKSKKEFGDNFMSFALAKTIGKSDVVSVGLHCKGENFLTFA